jgi:hypothetical protein
MMPPVRRARPEPSSRSLHGSPVRPRPCHATVHIGHGRVCSRRRRQSAGGGSNGTPKPSQTSWACRTNSTAARGTKSSGAPVRTSGNRKMAARSSDAASLTTAASIRVAIRSECTKRAGVASFPKVRSTPTSGYPSIFRDARKNAGAYTQSTAWSAVLLHDQSRVHARADQSRSALAVHT